MGMKMRRNKTLFFSLTSLILVGIAGCQSSSVETIPMGKELCKSKGLSVVRGDENTTPFPGLIHSGSTECRANATTILNLLGSVWEVDSQRIDARVPLPDGYFNIVTPGIKSPDTAQTAFSKALAEAFHIKIHWEDESKPAWIVTAPGGRVPSGMKISAPEQEWSYGTSTTGLHFSAFTVNGLVSWMEASMSPNDLVVNETNLPDRYDFIVNDDALIYSDRIPEYVRALGFEVQKEQRMVRMLVVEKD
jgi:uncharacterized protein (TIGR03435 family)